MRGSGLRIPSVHGVLELCDIRGNGRTVNMAGRRWMRACRSRSHGDYGQAKGSLLRAVTIARTAAASPLSGLRDGMGRGEPMGWRVICPPVYTLDGLAWRAGPAMQVPGGFLQASISILSSTRSPTLGNLILMLSSSLQLIEPRRATTLRPPGR